MAFTTEEQSVVDQLITNSDKAFVNAQNIASQLTEHIKTLTEARDALQASETTDQNQVRKLTDMIRALQTTQSNVTDFVAALTGFKAHVNTFNTPNNPTNPSTPNVGPNLTPNTPVDTTTTTQAPTTTTQAPTTTPAPTRTAATVMPTDASGHNKLVGAFAPASTNTPTV
jgi:hypothetical protein